MEIKSCCFIGHRKVPNEEKVKEVILELIESLIVEENVRVFNFGSRSDFDYLCHEAVTKLREKYSDIKRIAYTCRSESCTLESEREYWEEIYSHFEKREVHLLGVEEEKEHKTKYDSGRASYVERNYAMIDDSDICVFYYNESYQPQRRKEYKSALGTYQLKSGTKIAYDYAMQKSRSLEKKGGRKVVINVYQESKE